MPRTDAGERFADWWGDNVFEPIAVVLFSLLGLLLIVAIVAFAAWGIWGIWDLIHV